MQVRSGKVRRLLVSMPPRTLKSIATSVAYPAWCLGHDPSLKFICVSYSSELATELARQFRLVVNSAWYKELFPTVRVVRDTADHVQTSKRGGRMATSIGGSLTGLGGGTIIIDDPLKGDDAHSSVARARVIDWYKNTLLSRFDNPAEGKLIVVMQRLHEEDLAGYLLETSGYQHLCLPAVAQESLVVETGPRTVKHWKHGELLHPRLLPQSELHQLKNSMGSQAFSAIYLQRPVPLDGNMIRRDWIRYYEPGRVSEGPGDFIVQSWDTALKAGDGNDYSVCTTWLMKGLDYYLLNVYRAKLEFTALRARAISLAKECGADYVLIEDKGSGTSLIQDLRANPDGLRPLGIQPENDKATRMLTETPALERGQVYLPAEAPWLSDFLHEFMAFPHGRHDDQVDSVSQFLRWAKEDYRHRPPENFRVLFPY